MPVGHLLHSIDHGRGSVLGCSARWPVHPQRLPAGGPGGEGKQVGQLAVVVDVQVSEEDVVDHLQRHLHREDVAQATRPEVEEEALAVAELDHDACGGLVSPRRERAAADEGDPHLILAELLRGRVVGGPAAHALGRHVVGRQGDPASAYSPVGIHRRDRPVVV